MALQQMFYVVPGGWITEACFPVFERYQIEFLFHLLPFSECSF
jgi:hypothetical protein